MIRLPSFFKRKTQSDDLELGSAGRRRTTKRVAPRSLQRAAEAEELALTEDPEQQRARHRLIGAAVLVLIAVIGLPRILDNKPKMAPNDIAVNIVTSLPIPSPATKPEVKAEEKPKAEVPIEVAKTPTPQTAPDSKTDTKAEANKVEVKPDAKTAPAKAAGLGLAAGEEVVATTAKAKAETKPKADDVSSKANTPAASGSVRYVIQIGAFASEDRAKGWIAKLKDQKIPNYVLNKTNGDGAKLFVLRAGPYADKDAADAAEKKIKAMGLSPRVVETGKQ
jgi:DedD protein